MDIYYECYKLKYKPEYLDRIKLFYDDSLEPDDWGAPSGCEVLCNGEWDELDYTEYIYCYKIFDLKLDTWLICCRTDDDLADIDEFINIIELETLDEWFNKILELASDFDEVDEEEMIITEEILVDNGFELMEYETELLSKYQKDNYGIDNYVMYRLWTVDKHPIKIDIDNGWNNSGRKWSVHIDNEACETIGYADINTIGQFNKLMEIFESNVALYI